MARPILADLSVVRASDAYRWVLVAAHVGANTRPARLTIAALKDRDNHQAVPEAIEWLVDEACSGGDRARFAREILREVAFPTVEHGILMDEGVAKHAAQTLKARGHIGVRTIPCPSGGFYVRSQGVAFDSLAGVA